MTEISKNKKIHLLGLDGLLGKVFWKKILAPLTGNVLYFCKM